MLRQRQSSDSLYSTITIYSYIALTSLCSVCLSVRVYVPKVDMTIDNETTFLWKLKYAAAHENFMLFILLRGPLTHTNLI